MNPVIEFDESSNRFESMANLSKPGAMSFPQDKTLTADTVQNLCDQLQSIQHTYPHQDLIGGVLIDVVCERVLPKSKRIKRLFTLSLQEPSDKHIRGARFCETLPRKHVFTYFLQPLVLNKAIERLVKLHRVLAIFPEEKIDATLFSDLFTAGKEKKGKLIGSSIRFSDFGLSKTEFCQLVCELVYIEEFVSYKRTVLQEGYEKGGVFQLIKTARDFEEIMSRLGITSPDVLNKQDGVFYFTPAEIKVLETFAPFLVSMSVKDDFKLSMLSNTAADKPSPRIPLPTSEPVIGVIDTAFDSQNAYFSDWVESCDQLGYDLASNPQQRNEAVRHGTQVCSIIVDGPSLNPDLDDGCGRFRVKHFRLLNGPGENSSISTILRKLESIIVQNTTIRVWNFSFGSVNPVSENHMSVIGAELDRLQYLYDVIFVVSGSNDERRDASHLKKLGAPADSLNSLVVNAISFSGDPASYSRCGPVLSFFTKPDVCYYGGDDNRRMNVWGPNGWEKARGTSFAAAWISRKVGYLIYYMRLSREAAKAMLIDSAAGWNPTDNRELKGFGCVPVRIEDVIQSQNDEIRFILTGECSAYETYTYALPIPIVDSKYPYYARATLCYFPEGERWQGVDYTQTELDIHFGRLVKKTKVVDSKVVFYTGIKPINNNTQGEQGKASNREAEARRLYRKWDNVKHICEKMSKRRYPREILNQENPLWGVSIRKKERANGLQKHGLRFGVVITLKEMYGINRINAFIKKSQALGWTVKPIDIDARINFYAEAEIDIDWDF